MADKWTVHISRPMKPEYDEARHRDGVKASAAKLVADVRKRAKIAGGLEVDAFHHKVGVGKAVKSEWTIEIRNVPSDAIVPALYEQLRAWGLKLSPGAKVEVRSEPMPDEIAVVGRRFVIPESSPSKPKRKRR